MNRFGPTLGHLQSACEKAATAHADQRVTPIDVIFDLQAHGASIERIVDIERDAIFIVT